MKKYLSLLVITLVSIGAEEVKVNNYNANYKMTYERLDVTPNEKMGLLGISTLFDLNSNWYGGATIYGAVDGERGGFFTLGIDSGLKTKLLSNIELKAGSFLGAGGGGAAPQGGGLMFRPYVEANFYNEDVSLGLGLSHIKFPNGEIESNQVYLLASIPTTGSYLSGHHFSNALDQVVDKLFTNNIKISFLTEYMTPSNSSLNTDGVTPTQDYGLIGAELEVKETNNLYSYYQLAAAGKGDSAGYMQVFGGLGYQYQLFNSPIYLKAQTALGAAGGGKIDTGGGLVYRADAGIDAQLSKHLSLGVKTGFMKSFNGTLSTPTYTGNIAYSTAIDETLLKYVDLSKVTTRPLSVRVLNKSYLNGEKLFKNSNKTNNIHLLGFAGDAYLNRNLYLTGQTFWAYKGDAGGYAEGLVGLGYKSDTYANTSVYTEALAGVGGGGGISIGGGAFASVTMGLSYDVTENLAGFVGMGYLQGKENSLSTTTLNYGLSYDFSFLGTDK